MVGSFYEGGEVLLIEGAIRNAQGMIIIIIIIIIL